MSSEASFSDLVRPGQILFFLLTILHPFASGPGNGGDPRSETDWADEHSEEPSIMPYPVDLADLPPRTLLSPQWHYSLGDAACYYGSRSSYCLGWILCLPLLNILLLD